ncbi:endoplasmic reticulum resident protein 29-like isoform X2 [Symsagittifera roscoffensis]|uniref:endoplasmic reticulum resident protein 29-like isoform X2 n=1 Tax=Symsagittifera roscoffensis TaxID=84072 RepID=UPI00307B4D35
MSVVLLISICFLAVCSFTSARQEFTTGVLELDDRTFDKVLSAFDAVLVKFSGDDIPDYILSEISEELGGDTRAIVGHVRLENPEPTNVELAERFHIQKDQWPQYYLFKKGRAEPIIFHAPDSSEEADEPENLKKFLTKNGLYLAKDGCLKKMDEIASEFVTNKDKRSELLETAKAQMEKYSDDAEKASAKVYVTYMKKIQEKGDEFVHLEAERLQKILGASMSSMKRVEVTRRANVIESFKASAAEKDEL